MHPKCKNQEQAESIVDQVFNSCFRDTRPFDEVRRLSARLPAAR
jgi:inner membrane protease ATP23